MEIVEPFLVYVITSVKPTNTPILVEIGSQGAPPHSGEISRFCDFCSPFFYIFFFCFLISPTGRNFQPIRMLDSSNNVFCFVHVPFVGLEPSNSPLGGLRHKRQQNFDPFSDFADLQRKLLQH